MRHIVILVDTTVWIDLFNAAGNEKTLKFEELISSSEDICICGIIMTEVLQGIKSDKQFNEILEILKDLVYLDTPKEAFILAAQIYRSCRKKDLTIRKPVDCLIASICIQNSLFILHNDRDFESIAKLFPLQKV